MCHVSVACLRDKMGMSWTVKPIYSIFLVEQLKSSLSVFVFIMSLVNVLN